MRRVLLDFSRPAAGSVFSSTGPDLTVLPCTNEIKDLPGSLKHV